MSADTIDQVDHLIERLERLGKLVVGVVKLLIAALALIISDAVWATKQDMVLSEHDRRLRDVESVSQTLNTDVSEIKGRLHGLSSLVGKVPGKVAQKLSGVEPN